MSTTVASNITLTRMVQGPSHTPSKRLAIEPAVERPINPTARYRIQIHEREAKIHQQEGWLQQQQGSIEALKELVKNLEEQRIATKKATDEKFNEFNALFQAQQRQLDNVEKEKQLRDQEYERRFNAFKVICLHPLAIDGN